MFGQQDHKEPYAGEDPGAGKVLIANPFLKDPNFSRSVILLCEHRSEGSFGFVFNRLFTQTLDDLIAEPVPEGIPVYLGGPVQMDTLHFIHRVPRLIEGGVKVLSGIYWGGDFERAIELLNMGMINGSQIKFFIGYAGWNSGQLATEMQENSWIVSRVTRKLLFDETGSNVWTESLRSMGDEFALMANYPVDPSLN
ncbi:MAG TPA: YqgE/AlgH family protein [Chitinophagaceae bacterium]|nr:YqgE/AlgH family protein [Chitinophagaceae bacterium]